MPDEVYIGTDSGVYISTTGGTTWAKMRVGIPSAPVQSLQVNGTTNRLVAATCGRSTWETLITDGVDTDGDGVDDSVDNCSAVANSNQRDTNGDGFGNICDQDLDNNGVVNFLDISMWVPNFNTACGDVDEDLTGDSACNFADYSIFPGFFGQPPGPGAVTDYVGLYDRVLNSTGKAPLRRGFFWVARMTGKACLEIRVRFNSVGHRTVSRREQQQKHDSGKLKATSSLRLTMNKSWRIHQEICSWVAEEMGQVLIG